MSATGFPASVVDLRTGALRRVNGLFAEQIETHTGECGYLWVTGAGTTRVLVGQRDRAALGPRLGTHAPSGRFTASADIPGSLLRPE